MAITLRELATGKPLGAGHIARDGSGVQWIVDNWSEGALKVYARRASHVSPGELLRPASPDMPHLFEFSPSDLGLYIGHARGQPVFRIRWGQKHVEPYAHPATRIEAVRRYNAELDAEERSPTGDDYNALLRILGV